MKYTTSETYDGMGEFLFRKWMDGELEADDEFRHEYGGFARFGRRVLVDDDGYGVDYERFDTFEQAIRRMYELHENRPPVAWDGIVSEDRGSYYVHMDGRSVGSFDTREDAELALARAMVDGGYFPDAFLVDNRGGWHRIDDDIRALHDAGGDKMRPDLVS